MLSRSIYLLLWMLACSMPVLAQLRLPQVDIELKGGFSRLEPPSNSAGSMDAPNWLVGAHIDISQRIGIGAFYAKSFRAEVKHGQVEGKNDAEALFTGLDLRLSAGRSVKWRTYLSLNYSKVEIRETLNGFNLAYSGNAIGASLGIMHKLGSNLYWNVLEIGAKQLDQKVYWMDSDLFLEARMGLTYNIRIKSK